MKVESGGDITLESGGDITLESGGDIGLYGNASDPALITFFTLDAAMNDCCILNCGPFHVATMKRVTAANGCKEKRY